MSGGYDDILSLPHPTSAKHPRMSAIDRAAQFSPFSALSGHEAAIRETARLTDRWIEMDEDEKAELDRRLRLVVAQPPEQQTVCITYFREDKKKTGGAYVTATGLLKKIDAVERMVLLRSGEQIPIDYIYQIESEVLRPLL